LKQRITGAYQKLKETNIISNFLNLSGIQFSNILLLLIIIRVVTSRLGIDQFGIISWSYRWAILLGAIINYGTNQSGVKEIALNIGDSSKLALVVSNIILVRAVVFLPVVSGLLIAHFAGLSYSAYLLFSVPVVLAEVINPLCLFIGTERLKVFNVCNMLSNVITVLVLIFCVHNRPDAVWVNFVIGLANVLTYLGLLIYFYAKWRIKFTLPSANMLRESLKNNFYLNINNASVNLQQSLILFAMVRLPGILGPYSLCDKIISQCRNLLIIISMAIYPNSAKLYHQSADLWQQYRRKTKYVLAGLFLAAALFMVLLANPIIYLLSGQHNATAVTVLRVMAFVPVLSALNATNVLDQLLKDRNSTIFRISMILLFIAIAVAFLSVQTGNYWLIASFTLMVEGCALLLYEYIIKKTSPKDA
jgi:O-antigen/teichoic acid export membrane protein